MADTITGGCLCGAIRFEADGAPIYAGFCFCDDCRKASGSGFIPFMGFAAQKVRFSGATRIYACPAFNGGEAIRNFCPECGGLVFGGIVGQDEQHTIYAGALDDPSAFEPKMAIFNSKRPPWVVLPPGVAAFDTMPNAS